MKDHVFAPTLTVAFFYFLVILGRAFFALAKVRMKGISSWLLSPAMGLAVLGLVSGSLNQCGLTIRSFGTTLVVILTAISIAILWWRKCRLPLQKLSIGAGMILTWLSIAGYPLLRYGGGWLSFVNDDFTNYCVGATRLLNHGFFDLPTEAQLHGKDYTAIYWLMHVATGARPVTDFVLAVVSVAARTTPREAFMPVILVFALTQVSALGGLLALSPRFGKICTTSMIVLSWLPLSLLGVYYQLFAQVGGLSLLLLVLALLVQSEPLALWRKSLLCLLPCAVAVAALLWFYPECAPFVLIPVGVMMLATVLRKHDQWGVFLRWCFFFGILVFVLLHVNTPMILNFLMRQVEAGTSTSVNNIFPYFMHEDGWVRTLGWATFFGPVLPYLWVLSVAVILAAFLMLVQKCRILQGLAGVAVVMFLMTFSMACKQNGFGLFKMAMFAQPVLAAGLALLWNAIPSRPLRWFFIIGWFSSTLPASWTYLRYSLGQPGGPCETPFATQLGFPTELKDKGACRIINVSVAQEKLIVLSHPQRVFTPTPIAFTAAQWGNDTHAVYFEHEKQQVLRMKVPFEYVQVPNGTNQIYYEPQDGASASTPRFLLEPDSLLRPFNRFFDQPKKREWFSISKIRSERNQNRLAWIPTVSKDEVDMAKAAYLAYYQGLKIEQDVADLKRTFWGAGRQLLFEVIQATPEIYLRVAFTRTYCGSGRVLLPEQAVVRGEQQEGLQFSGSGSANVIVGPIKPGQMKGRSLVSLDLGMPAQQFFEGDSRQFCGWIRDVSAMSPERYLQLVRPSELQVFPDDLLNNPALEYSGIYEDGSIDQKSWIGLSTPSSKPSGLLLAGEVPSFPGLEMGNRLSLYMNGALLREIEVGAGRFSAFVILPAAERSWARFELKWAKASRYPGGDDRPVAARLQSLRVIPIK
ncbi:hypothetical protein BH11VER1_BH11VER1_00550 [soil metagenome]